MNHPGKYVVSRNIPASLNGVPHHNACDAIERLVPNTFPVHVAIHRVKKITGPTNAYVQPHTHDVPEINILLGDDGQLEYEFQLGDEVLTVESPASVWIPAGTKHAATVRRGSGYFVCVILDGTEAICHDDCR